MLSCWIDLEISLCLIFQWWRCGSCYEALEPRSAPSKATTHDVWPRDVEQWGAAIAINLSKRGQHQHQLYWLFVLSHKVTNLLDCSVELWTEVVSTLLDGMCLVNYDSERFPKNCLHSFLSKDSSEMYNSIVEFSISSFPMDNMRRQSKMAAGPLYSFAW